MHKPPKGKTHTYTHPLFNFKCSVVYVLMEMTKGTKKEAMPCRSKREGKDTAGVEGKNGSK